MAAKLLLAEDSLTIQKVFELTFKQTDISLTTVDNGDDAVRLAQEISPDLVVADVSLPGKDGFEVAAELQSRETGRSCPVLILAGTLAPFNEERFKDSGASGVLFKPFESQDLIEKVEALLRGEEEPATEPEDKEHAPPPAEEPWDFSDVMSELENEAVVAPESRTADAGDPLAEAAVPMGAPETTLALGDFDVSLEDIERGPETEATPPETELLTPEGPGEIDLKKELLAEEGPGEIDLKKELLAEEGPGEIFPDAELMPQEEPGKVAPETESPAPEEPGVIAPPEDAPEETYRTEDHIEEPTFDDSPQAVTDLTTAFEMVQEQETVRELEDVDFLDKIELPEAEAAVPHPEEEAASPPSSLVPETAPSEAEPEGLSSSAATAPLPGEEELRELFSVRAQEIFQKVAAETVEKVMWETMENLTKEFTERIRESVEAVAWEVVPATTEAIIREEIARIREEAGKESS
jgi:DNA-binding response OmpR family regulator